MKRKPINSTLMSLLFLILLVNIPSSLVQSQPTEEWSKNYGGVDSDWGNNFQLTSDGGYIIVGDTESYGYGQEDVYLVKTDSDGNIQWDKYYGGTMRDIGYSVTETSDGYIIVGYTISSGAGGSDVYVIKTDDEGNVLWEKTYGGSADDSGRSILGTEDGGYIIAGDTRSYGQGATDLYLLKIDSDGNLQWNTTHGGKMGDTGSNIQVTIDRGYVVVGETGSWGAGGTDAYLVKFDSNGGLLWNITYGGSDFDRGRYVQQTSDGGYIITGETGSSSAGEDDVYLIKTDAEGDMLWETAFGGAYSDNGWAVIEDHDEGYLIVGDTESMGAGQDDVYLIKTDSDGKLVWETTIGGFAIDNGRSIQLTDDGGFIFVGRTWNMGPGGDVYLVKMIYDVEPESEPEPEPEPEPESEPEPEPEKQTGIPGFPYQSLMVGIVISLILLWMFQRKR